MKRTLAVLVATLVAFAISEGVAQAQFGASSTPRSGSGAPSFRRSARPPVSPYVGLLGAGQNGTGLGYQYFTRVKPQRDASRAIRELGRSVKTLQGQTPTQLTAQQIADQTSTGIGPTGHAVAYNSHVHYFGTNINPATRR